MCTRVTGKPGPPETATHLAQDCPSTVGWVVQVVGPIPEGDRLNAILGDEELQAEAIRLVGRIARAVRKAAGEAEKIEERIAWDDWFDAGGVLQMLEELARRPVEDDT